MVGASEGLQSDAITYSSPRCTVTIPIAAPFGYSFRCSAGDESTVSRNNRHWLKRATSHRCSQRIVVSGTSYVTTLNDCN